MEYFAEAVEFSLLLVIGYACFIYWKYKDFPPGPYGIPFLGYAPFLGANPHVALRDLSRKYGPILTVNMGNNQTVFVHKWETIQEVLVKQGDAFSNRPFIFTLYTTLQRRENDILTTHGPASKELKRITVQILKELGMGKSSLESSVEAEVENLAAYLKERDGQLIDADFIFFIPLMNIIWRMTSGDSFDMTDTSMKEFADALHTVTGKSHVGILNMAPLLRFVAPQLGGYTTFAEASKKIFTYIDKVVDEHIASNDGQKTDLMHYFIEEIKNRQKDNKDQPPYCKLSLSGAAFDMFAAGVETMDTNLVWSLLLMAYFPEVQEKVQRELDASVAEASHVSYSARATLIPFTEATLCEIQRFISISPFAAPHCAAKDTVLGGYKIPKGTTVITNLWALDHDKDFWGDPDEFRPERFLDDEGKLAKNERFIPFSAGPRVCPGEPLAKMQLTLFFSCLMRRFKFQLDPNQKNPKSLLDANVGILIRPHPFQLIVNCR